MCSWGDNAPIWAFVPMCLYTGRAQRLGPSWAIWTKLSFCHLAFMSPWWKENANSRRSGNSFHNPQHPDGSWGLWLRSHCSNGKPKQALLVPSSVPSPERLCPFSSWADELSFLAKCSHSVEHMTGLDAIHTTHWTSWGREECWYPLSVCLDWGDRPPSVSLKAFPRMLTWRGKTHPKPG